MCVRIKIIAPQCENQNDAMLLLNVVHVLAFAQLSIVLDARIFVNKCLIESKPLLRLHFIFNMNEFIEMLETTTSMNTWSIIHQSCCITYV